MRIATQPDGAGLWLVTTGVTPGVTGFVPCCDLSARGCWPRPGWRSWPDQELDHLALEAPDVGASLGGDHVDRLVQVAVPGRDGHAPIRASSLMSVASLNQRSTITAWT